ncbi:MAG: HEPN domain-containing protein [Pseudomonadota bacterium]
MAALDDVDELFRAHKLVTGGQVGAPPISNGARVGSSLLRASTTLISAALQTAVEDTFQAAIREEFDHFSDDEYGKYWEASEKSWGNPNPHNIRNLFFRIGYSDVLDGLSWQKCNNASVVATLDAINQIRNRVAHGQPLTVNGQPFRLTRPTVNRWRNFAGLFINKFQPFVLSNYDD